jgi:anti-sigma factor RsiW
MKMEFKCGDPAALAGYLYDECDAAERAAIEAHLATCANCAAELAALGATRTALAAWRPPDVELGFRITSDREAVAAGTNTVLRPKQWWQRPLPAWAQAAAAVLIFTAGALMGMRTSQSVAPLQPTSIATAPAGVSSADLAAVEQRLRKEMVSLRSSSVPQTVQTVQTSTNEEALVRRVNALLAESERRQQRELALRLTQVLRDVDSQRTMDLSRIERTFGQMEGVTRPELAEQRQMLNYLIQRTTLQQRAPQ